MKCYRLGETGALSARIDCRERAPSPLKAPCKRYEDARQAPLLPAVLKTAGQRPALSVNMRWTSVASLLSP